MFASFCDFLPPSLATALDLRSSSRLLAVNGWGCVLAALLLGAGRLQMAAQGAEVEFERDVAPLLIRHCVECHSAVEKQGGLDLTHAAGLRAGGESGLVLDAANLSASRLLERIVAGEMPPPLHDVPRRLPEAEIGLLKAWIEAGAPWPDDRRLDLYERTTETRGGRDWWSLQPIRRPALPTLLEDEATGANEVDAFVRRQLRSRALRPAPIADRRTLIRRATIDLWGLCPTVDEVEAFVAENDAGAYERLIDRLLASPRYGERWARHWLDVVRYADTCGFERDQLKPNIWKYRDWVIDAFNADMPYDRFVVEQLAGDEIPDRSESSVVATGMLRAGAWNDEPNDPADYVYERLEDMVHVASSAFLGLTVKCARCHDHKFDPIEQQDYYRLASYFWAGYIGQANLGGPSKEELGYDLFGWTDRSSTPEPLHLLVKGERARPGPVVEPGFLSAVAAVPRAFSAPSPGARTTQRRLQFARWLTHPRHPLTARVIVNRVWRHHFGAGIVRSTNNFGFKGDKPTHPELLDWLAADLIDGGWRLKRMHKQIMMSQTYRQSCDHPAYDEYAQRDFSNQFLWRTSRRRMEAETLRDALLLASGELNLVMGGPGFYPHMSSEALEGLSRKDAAWTASPRPERNRRSVYMTTTRSRVLPLMTVFDFCDTTLPCGERDATTVPTQALALLNNDFVHECSLLLAERIVRAEDADADLQVERAFRAVLARNPDPYERQEGRRHIDEQLAGMASAPPATLGDRPPSTIAIASLCHVLMNSNEFLYVE